MKIFKFILLILILPGMAIAADQNLTQKTEDVSPTSDDLVYLVNDPGGTPADRKATLSNVLGTSLNNIREGSGTVDLSGNAVILSADDPAMPSEIAVDDLDDPSTPHVLTTNETINKTISNYAASGADRVFSMPTAHTNGSGLFVIGDEFQIDIEPPAGAAFYLNGTEMSADEHIINSADTLGEVISFYVANLNGTLRYLFESKYTNFAEQTP